MYSRFLSPRRALSIIRFRLIPLLAIFMALLWPRPALFAADQSNPTPIGRVEGRDVSVEGGTSAGASGGAASQAILVSSGSIITVHSGQALLTLAAGGQLDICGPAKLTVLQSSGAITIALNFGRLRVQLPAGTPLRIFTPTIIATPLEIGGAARDVTLGLELNNSLCVLATSGALRLEQQFTGEGLIIPQSGEFFLGPGTFAPIAGTPGTCHCEAIDARAVPARPPSPPVPEMGAVAKSYAPPAPEPAPKSDPKPAPAPATPVPEPLVTLGVLTHANESHPSPTAPKDAVPPPPPVSMPEYKIDLPPLTFSASSPTPPPDPAPDTILIIRIARLEPEWQFTGRVESPRFEQVTQRTSSRPASSQQVHPKSQQQKKKGGFWAALKHIFVGNSEVQN